eukprot:TRINITY_DN1384_c0_g3_i2.p1 TRINITY_DN1384_c0_g3~~TRINITY_DN1384_c0_g3_i2.p1  ORF type:complete len:763 (+),score=205.33 TRINITY_DN1384_c0_g3_i2:75-2363(+)
MDGAVGLLRRVPQGLWLRRQDLSAVVCWCEAASADPFAASGLRQWLQLSRRPDLVAVALRLGGPAPAPPQLWADCLGARLLPRGYERLAVQVGGDGALMLALFAHASAGATDVAAADCTGEGVGLAACCSARRQRLLFAVSYGGGDAVSPAVRSLAPAAAPDGDPLDSFDYALWCCRADCAATAGPDWQAAPMSDGTQPRGWPVLWRTRRAPSPAAWAPFAPTSVTADAVQGFPVAPGCDAASVALRLAACVPRDDALCRAERQAALGGTAEALAEELRAAAPGLDSPSGADSIARAASPLAPSFADGGPSSGDEDAMLATAEGLLRADGPPPPPPQQLGSDAPPAAAPLAELELIGEGLTCVVERLCAVEARLGCAGTGGGGEESDGPRLVQLVAGLRGDGAQLARKVEALARTVAEAELPAPLHDADGLEDGERMRRCELRAAYLAGYAAAAASRPPQSCREAPGGAPQWPEGAACAAEDAAAAVAEAALLLRRERAASARADAAEARARAAEGRLGALEERLRSARGGEEGLRQEEERLAARELELLRQQADLSRRELQLRRERADLEEARCGALRSGSLPEPLTPAASHPFPASPHAPGRRAARRADDSLPPEGPRPAPSSGGGVPQDDAKLSNPGTPRGSEYMSAPASCASSSALSVSSPHRRDRLALALERWLLDPNLPPNFARCGVAPTTDRDDEGAASTFLYQFGARRIAIRLARRLQEPRVLIGAGSLPFGDFVARFGAAERRRMSSSAAAAR